MSDVSMKNILVVGGAGYIGSHMCKLLWNHGYQPIVLDNLIRGHQQAVKWGPFIKGVASNRNKLKKIFRIILIYQKQKKIIYFMV